MLQTRSVVTAQFLADQFGVTERTIYRDIRTLENAGVPIGSEAGVGYFLEKGYRLPPVSFTLDEAASLLLGEKLLQSTLDLHSYHDYKLALSKVRAVMDTSDKDYLQSLDADIEVIPTGRFVSPKDQHELHEHLDAEQSAVEDRWLREARTVLVRRQVVRIVYAAGSSDASTEREIEPIGLFYYSLHWHLIAWCRLRENYRDFRLDRIIEFEPKQEQFARHSRETLQDYIHNQPGQEELIEVELLFTADAARFVSEQRYLYGFTDQERTVDGVLMRFLTPSAEYMGRWLLQYTQGVQILKGEPVKQALQALTKELAEQWDVN